MRIHRLELKAYGPFPGTVAIDFDDLNREGIFLLNGPTGSGKSSILDAICFALYGTTSSGRTDLKSRFAEPAVQPRVTLECTIGGTRYRIERNPAYERPKKRGEGTITEQAKTLIEKYDAATGEWESDPTITRHKDAGDFMLSVLGLNAQQFNQVMLLPQGQFQRFLLASSGEREQLLKKLFGTYEFEAIQNLLTEQAKEAGHRAEQASHELEVLIGRGQRAEHGAHLEESYALLGLEGLLADSDSESTTLSADNPASAPGYLEELAAELGQLHSQLLERTGQVAEELTRVNDQRAQMIQLNQHWQEYSQLTLVLDKLESARETVTQQSSLLESHRKATLVLPFLTAEERALASCESTRQRVTALSFRGQELASKLQGNLDQRARELATVEKVLDLLKDQQDVEHYEQISHDLAEYAKDLQALDRDEQRLIDLAAEQKQAQAQGAPLESKVCEAEQDLTAHRKKIQDLEEEYKGLENAPVELEKAGMDYAGAQEAQQKARALVRARQRVEQAEQAATETESKRVRADHQADELHRRRFENAALILAEALVAGQPCSVCGSRQHPAPATGLEAGAAVSEEALQKARAQRTAAETEASRALGELSAARESLDQLTRSGAPEPETAQNLIAQAQDALTRAQKAQTRRDELDQLLQEGKTHEEKLRAQLVAAQRLVAEHKATIQERARTLAELEAGLKPQTQKMSFADRAHALTSLNTCLTQLGNSRLEQSRQAEVHRLAQAETAQALSQSGWSDQAQVRAAHLAPAQAQKLEQEIRHHQERVLATRARLESPALLSIAERASRGETAPDPQDLAVLTSRLETLSREKDELIAHSTRILGAEDEIIQVQQELTAALTRSQELIETAHLRQELAATANATPGSDNHLRMTLTTYVLAYQLSEVALAASEHLEKMTHGRYRLEHSDRAQGRGKSGLGLLVFDSWHNAHRQPASLSGGESFMASLALALGLADVVQQANGGIEIDTLFIDEGFGSLDDETLEEVMSTIDSLRERGRVIGLISHVAEMKNRINRHILLQTSPQGSSLVKETGAV